MNVPKCALPRTDMTVKEFLIALCDKDHAYRRLPFTADTQIMRLFWPEKVSRTEGAQWSGWSSFDMKPFQNLSHAVELLRHVHHDARVTIEVVEDKTRVTVFHRQLQAGVCAEDPQPEYAVCKGLLNAYLTFDGAMYGYVLGMGLINRDPIFPGNEAPRIDVEEIVRHRELGDISRNYLGRDPKHRDEEEHA